MEPRRKTGRESVSRHGDSHHQFCIVLRSRPPKQFCVMMFGAEVTSTDAANVLWNPAEKTRGEGKGGMADLFSNRRGFAQGFPVSARAWFHTHSGTSAGFIMLHGYGKRTGASGRAAGSAAGAGGGSDACGLLASGAAPGAAAG